MMKVTTQEALILLAAGKKIIQREADGVFKEELKIIIHKGSFWVNDDDGLTNIMYLNDYDLFADEEDFRNIILPIHKDLDDIYD